MIDDDERDEPFTQAEFDALSPEHQRLYHLGQRDAYRQMSKLTAVEWWKANQEASRR